MFGAECWTDHRLIVSKFNLGIKSRQHHQGRKPTKTHSKLGSTTATEHLARDLDGKMQDLQFGQTNVNEDKTTLRDTVCLSIYELIGHTVHKNDDWFDKNIKEIKSIFFLKNMRQQSLPK
uniref:Uncharacterized protein n=1 Tax=Arion vulgaris TaxID=1028688 RepID=A0A0B6ZKL7_9EUPU